MRPDRMTGLALLAVIVTRFVHFAYAVRSPLTFQIGPDEDYYLRFGLDVAFGSGGMTPEFAFMDPLYGYLLGAVLWFSGGTVFPAYLLQVLVDCGTAYGVMLICRELDRPRMGVLAMLVYALLGPAMAFSMALLKATWVAGFVCWWVYLALRLVRTRGTLAWLAFGAYCGVGAALRSNLLLLAAIALPLLPLLWRTGAEKTVVARAQRCALLLTGLALPLLLLAARNHAIDGRWSPVPTNGGIVLHQLYNPENPGSRSGAPSFVQYGHPTEIWRAYSAEAAKRAGRQLTQRQVERYWRSQAMAYLFAHPWQDMRNGLRKLAEFSAYIEVPNNRSYEDERRFSPLLRWLPQPFGWLFALGVPGLVLLAVRDRRAWVLLAPVAMGLVTITVFFAEDRFRFNIIVPFVVGSAAWIAFLWHRLRERAWRDAAFAAMVSIALGAWSVAQAHRLPRTPMDWQRIATGYFKMGEREKLEALLHDVQASQPNAIGLDEFRGLIALSDGDVQRARKAFEAALAQRQNRHEVWHNYASVLTASGEHDAALVAEAMAYSISPSPEYAYRMAGLLERLGRTDEARAIYASLAAGGPPWAARAAERSRALDAVRPATDR